MALGMVMALAFIHARVRVAGRLLAIRQVMAHLTGQVLRGSRTVARHAFGQRRNSRPQRQA